MFRHLRLRLTLLYLLVALLLVALIGASTYALLRRYFQTTTDLALQHRMAQEFRRLGARMPPELAAADNAWYTSHNQPLPGVQTVRRSGADRDEPRERDDDHDQRDDEASEHRETYDGELAAIFVLPLSAEGTLLLNPIQSPAPITPDRQAAAAALASGSDLRTARLDSTSVRLLTYRLASANGPALLQLGRTLADQDRLLSQFLLWLLGLGGAGAVFLGAGSWWLAGRSLQPAQQAWARQQSFVANASHELRTPLTLLRASAEVALRHTPPREDAQRALLGDVLHECDHMARLVEDLLLLSRLDAGHLPLDRQAVLMPELLADVRRQVGRLAEERGIRLATDGDGAALGDPARLRQVLLILLDNALRHTPPGGRVQISARQQGRQLHLSIADTGVGIAPEHLPHVLDRFYRADNARASDGGGSGLGLAIAKTLISALRGEIRIASRLGEGTRVDVTLPAATPSPPSTPRSSA